MWMIARGLDASGARVITITITITIAITITITITMFVGSQGGACDELVSHPGETSNKHRIARCCPMALILGQTQQSREDGVQAEPA